MIVQTTGKIFLSDQRGCTQTDVFRSFHTYNFGAYVHPHKRPKSDLFVFNEDTLRAESSIKQTIEAQTTVVLIPILGTIEVKNGFNTEGSYVTVGEAYFFTTVDEETMEVSNPYNSEMVSYLHFRLKNTQYQPFNSECETSFDFENARNKLLPFFPNKKNTTAWGVMGQYDGRAESVYTLKNPENGVFAFVIEGVFEVQNRLLHARDGLFLSEIEEVELEALSNDAVILLIESVISH